jgi:phosphorylcholine metabolism protein LicD
MPKSTKDMESEETEKESPEVESKADREGVKVSEEFQKEVYELVYEATQEECAYMRNCLSEREDVLRKAEREKEMKGRKPKEFTTAEAPVPSDY